MKPLVLLVAAALLLGLASCEPPVGKRPLIFSSSNWPPKSAKQLASRPGAVAGAGGKQRTLVVQIRSDQPVPLLLKGRPGAHSHSHAAHTHAAHLHGHSLGHSHLLHGGTPHHHLRGSRPLKLSAPVYLKPASSLRKPLKIKLNNSKPQSKPSFGYEKPFKYEKPTALAYSELQNLPLEQHNSYNNEHFAPIYTVPAPNLALAHHDHDNQLEDSPDTAYLPPTPQIPQSTLRPQAQTYLPPAAAASSYYSVHEEATNDQTILDPFSGSQKLFAPDPDPSLPTSKVKIATESFNTPSNNKPLPADVQSNHLPAQPLVQIVGAQTAAQTAVPIYPIQFAQQTTQPFAVAPVLAPAAAHIPIYNPTYLVTQSNQLYSQHKQQLFKPSVEHVIETGYVNADLTQEVASNGQILQAAKDPHHNIHPVLDAAPQYAALIAAPALNDPAGEPVYETAPFHLPNVAAAAVASTAPEGGFVVSNYYGNAHDSSQLLQAYAEEEARRQQLETEQAAFELQRQQQQQLHLEELHAQAHAQLQEQQQQQELQHQQELQLEELQAQAQAQHLQQQQHQQQQQQLQLLQLQHQQHQHQQQQQQQQQQQAHPQDAAAAAFEEHQRLVQQQLGSNTPLRIFVPDEEAESQRLQKRSDNLQKASVKEEQQQQLEDDNDSKDLFPVSSSVEVAGGQAEVSSK